MTDEENKRFERIERSLEFVAAQQAKFSVDIDRMNATIDKINGTLGKHAEAIVSLTGWMGRLAEAQVRLTEIQQETSGKVAELVEAGKRTDERLDALITTVEKYIAGRNGRGGRKPRRRKGK